MGGLQNLHKNEASYGDDIDVDGLLKTGGHILYAYTSRPIPLVLTAESDFAAVPNRQKKF